MHDFVGATGHFYGYFVCMWHVNCCGQRFESICAREPYASVVQSYFMYPTSVNDPHLVFFCFFFAGRLLGHGSKVCSGLRQKYRHMKNSLIMAIGSWSGAALDRFLQRVGGESVVKFTALVGKGWGSIEVER